MRSRGAESAAIVNVSDPYPAKNPCTARSASTCHGRCTNAIAPITTTKLTSDRSTMIFRPERSASLPQSGPSMAVKAGVPPRLRPDHMAISPTSSTPSNLKYSARKGITSVKPVNPIKLAAVTANRFLRHCVYEGSLISEPHSHSARLLDMDGVDETDPRRMTLHDQRAGPDTVAEEADAFHERPVRHPGGSEDDVLAAREILR